jgi:hypothetical protein
MRTFVSALESASVPITKDNMGGLTQLCEEFHFRELAERLSQFRESDDFKEDGTQKDLEARKRLLALEERMQQRECDIAALRTELSRQFRAQESASEALLGRVARLEAEASALRSAAETETKPALAQLQSDVARLKADFSALQLAPSPARPPAPAPTPPRPTVPAQKSASVAPAAPTSPPAIPPSGSVPRAVVPIASAPAPTSPLATPPLGWNSAIVPDFPKLFDDFKKKQFPLLWRGSRDGFAARDFHNRCDGHPKTLTVVLDTKGNIFGGFTPVEWESRTPKGNGNNCWKADPSLKSFLFTLKNPHNFPAQRFPLKAEENRAICCNSDSGPCFCDIYVSDKCNANTDSYTSNFGRRYTNDTGLDVNSFLPGGPFFQVKEIEVFEITD